LVRAGEEDGAAAAVAELPGDLRSGEGRLNGNVDGADELDCEVGENPLVAIFTDVGDAFAGLCAEIGECRSESADVGGDVSPGEPLIFAAAFDAESGLGAVGFDATRE
jgi:hypothetical protein